MEHAERDLEEVEGRKRSLDAGDSWASEGDEERRRRNPQANLYSNLKPSPLDDDNRLVRVSLFVG